MTITQAIDGLADATGFYVLTWQTVGAAPVVKLFETYDEAETALCAGPVAADCLYKFIAAPN